MSGLSEPVTGTTAPDVTPPTTPTGLKVTGTGISTVSLAWDRASDRWSFRYEVLMDGEVVTAASHPFTGTPTTTLRKIPPGTHTFEVRARDFSGNVSGLSNAQTVTLEGTGTARRRPRRRTSRSRTSTTTAAARSSDGRRRPTTPTRNRRSSTSCIATTASPI